MDNSRENIVSMFRRFGFEVKDQMSNRGNLIGILQTQGKTCEMEQFTLTQGNRFGVLITTRDIRGGYSSAEIITAEYSKILEWIQLQIPKEI